MAVRKTNPYLSLANSYLIDSPQPSSINYWWNLGSLLGLCLVIQIASGIFLAMHYSSNIELAFDSVEHIMRDVNAGWLIRYIHANGASFFFICMYLHIAKALYYGSYKTPRVLVWSIGVIIFVVTIATAFMGFKHSSPKFINKHKFNLPLKKNNFNNLQLNFNRSFSIKSHYNKDLTIKSLIKEKSLRTSEDIFKEIGIEPEIYWDNLEESFLVKKNLKKELKDKSGIYIIINKVNLDYYIGSAHVSKFYTRFHNHLYTDNSIGSKVVHKAVKEYGINNFIFAVLEFYPFSNDFDHKELFALETSYISLLLPAYNIFTEARNIGGSDNVNLNSSKLAEISLSKERKILLQEIRNKHLKIWETRGSSKLISLFLDNNFLCEFKNINTACHYLCCSYKTIYRARQLGYIYVPKLFLQYLNNEHIDNHNSIIEFIYHYELEDNYTYKGSKNKHFKIKATLKFKPNFVKLLIKSTLK